jgi:two-component system, sensor histidine kinase LadS
MERLVAGRLAENSEAPPLTNGFEKGKEPGFYEVLTGIAEMFTSEAEAKGLKLRLVLAAPDANVAAYPLMRVVSNLVSNAIKYTRTGRVIIALRRRETGYFVEVHDTGPGLAGVAFAQALGRNHRLDRDLDAAEGTGLGLSVVTETVHANAWKISSCEARTTGASIRIML